MTAHHLKPDGLADFQLASDLGRKAGAAVTEAILRTMALGETPYQREVTALSAAVAAITCARIAMRNGSAPNVSDQDLLAALIEQMADAEKTRGASA